MDFTESVKIMSIVIEKVMPFLVVVTISVSLCKMFLKSLKGRL